MNDEWDNDFHTRLLMSFTYNHEDMVPLMMADRPNEELIERIDIITDYDQHNLAIH